MFMRRKTRSKMPLIRLMLVMVLAVMLFGAGFYAYYKRNAAQGLTLVDMVDQMKGWVALHKKQLHETLQASKNDAAEDELPEEQVKFEFYDSLADMQVKVSESAPQPELRKLTQAAEPVNKQVNIVAKHQKDKQNEANQVMASQAVVNPDEFEKAFYAAMTAKKKS
jgi:hypothetical protein